MTLVFATARTAAAIKEALFARRTVVYSGEKLIGDEQFLKPIFERSIRFNKTAVTLKGKDREYLQVANNSDVTYELDRVGDQAEMQSPKTLILPARKTVLFEVRGKSSTVDEARRVSVNYRVKNLLVGPDEPLVVGLAFEVTFKPAR